MKRNFRYSIIILVCIAIMFTFLGVFLNSFNTRKVNVNVVNAKEYVNLKDISIAIKNINYITEDGKNFIVLNISANKPKESTSNLSAIFGTLININGKIINGNISHSKINGKKFYDSYKGYLLTNKELEINPDSKFELYYQCDDINKEQFSNLESIGILYPLKLYMDEIKLKSNKLNTFRILAQFKM